LLPAAGNFMAPTLAVWNNSSWMISWERKILMRLATER
jgi:hypothetical protein